MGRGRDRGLGWIDSPGRGMGEGVLRESFGAVLVVGSVGSLTYL